MLIKFSKQIGNSFAKIIKTSGMELFTRAQNLAKHVRWNFLQK